MRAGSVAILPVDSQMDRPTTSMIGRGTEMHIDRRTMLAGTAAAFAAAPALAQRKAAANWFDNAIIIDALGGFGDPEAGEGVSRYTDKTWADTVATGVTVVRDTVMPVGNIED